MSLLIIQPVGLTLRERTTNGIRAYVTWDAIERVSEHQRELVLKSVREVKGVEACSWYYDRTEDRYLLLIERQMDLKWAGTVGIGQYVCKAVGDACDNTFTLQVGITASPN